MSFINQTIKSEQITLYYSSNKTSSFTLSNNKLNQKLSNLNLPSRQLRISILPWQRRTINTRLSQPCLSHSTYSTISCAWKQRRNDLSSYQLFIRASKHRNDFDGLLRSLGPRLSRFHVCPRPTLDRSMCHRVPPGKTVVRPAEEGREREREESSRREGERPVFVEMLSYLRASLGQRSRQRRWREDVENRDLLLEESFGGNLFIEPLDFSLSSGQLARFTCTSERAWSWLIRPAGYRTRFRGSWLYTTFSPVVFFLRLWFKRNKAGWGNWVFDGLGDGSDWWFPVDFTLGDIFDFSIKIGSNKFYLLEFFFFFDHLIWYDENMMCYTSQQ